MRNIMPTTLKNTVHYAGILEYFEEMKAAHLSTYKPTINQILLGSNSDYEVCCDPNSQSKYPNYPNCTCT